MSRSGSEIGNGSDSWSGIGSGSDIVSGSDSLSRIDNGSRSDSWIGIDNGSGSDNLSGRGFRFFRNNLKHFLASWVAFSSVLYNVVKKFKRIECFSSSQQNL
ncbi:hypothetical protein Tco_0671304 [Tanacetum coccineum]